MVSKHSQLELLATKKIQARLHYKQGSLQTRSQKPLSTSADPVGRRLPAGVQSPCTGPGPGPRTRTYRRLVEDLDGAWLGHAVFPQGLLQQLQRRALPFSKDH